jgi:SAM-dependent methyltransferase
MCVTALGASDQVRFVEWSAHHRRSYTGARLGVPQGYVLQVTGWEDYYRAIEGRAPRALFLDALTFVPDPGLAVDLGCGDGTETLALLADGWTVVAADAAPEGIARLRASVPAEAADRLTTIVAPFHELDLPQADFVYAGLSLPFCAPKSFAEAWRRITGAVRAEGIVAAHFFGPKDSWSDNPDMTFHARAEVESLFDGFEIRRFEEQDEDGQAVSGAKHWHVFHVIAARR